MTQATQQDVRAVAPVCMAGDICRNPECPNAVAQQGVRWFITMGHPGYNSRSNNGAGYAMRQDAVGAFKRYSRPRAGWCCTMQAALRDGISHHPDCRA